MTYDELISYYGNPASAAAARGLDRQIVYGWKVRGRIPLEQQVQYEVSTNGDLRADLPDEIRNPKSDADGGDGERAGEESKTVA